MTESFKNKISNPAPIETDDKTDGFLIPKNVIYLI